ncbi:MAG: outer membrane beta-barrel protein [Bacteroidales bacterium]|nr:outer membrane beta-barrel protein [Bacteroidales bacterium]
MKKAGLLVALVIMVMTAQSQMITSKTSKNVSVGFDIYTDILTKIPADMDSRMINQGFNAYATYNFKIGDGPHIFAIGTGIRTHNFYSNTRIANIKADTILFRPISDDLDYKRSKLSLVYLDFPAELRLYFKDHWKVGVGFKMGLNIDSKEKYFGQFVKDGPTMLLKQKKINSLEKYTYGPTLRIGYKWINAFAFYQVTRTFQRDLGPEMYPLSVGLTITPF